GLRPAHVAGDDVRVAEARLDHTRRACDRSAKVSFPARLQGRPALQRRRAKDRGDAENRRKTLSNSFFTELKRRNVIRAAGLYLVGAWLLTQVASTVLPMFGAPEWLPRSIVMLLVIGFVPALIFSWVFGLPPQGLKRDEDVPPEQSIGPKTGR